MPKIVNETFCIMPFVHANIRTNGDIRLCCVSAEKTTHNIKNSSVIQWWNSIDSVRNNMLAGNPISACNVCYQQEKHGLTSQRQSNNKKFKILSENYAEKIVNLYYKNLSAPIDYELQITNICNLKCIMCGEFDSSALLSENKTLKISNFNQSEYSVSQKEINKILELIQNPLTESVTFRGGEPLLIPQIKNTMLEVIKSNRSKFINIQLVTNCTEFDQEWVEILNNFKSVWIICSIDAIEERYEFIRYGASWSQVINNINLIKTIKNVNITVNAVVQNINLLGISNLINWCEDNDLYINLTRLLEPRYLMAEAAPEKIKTQALEQLKNINYRKVENLSGIIQYIADSTCMDYALWKEFIQAVKIKDNHRKTNFINSFPEFKEYFDAKTN